MTQKPVFAIADLATEIHQRIAEENLSVDPVFEVRQSKRNGGFPADILTIDCHKSHKRILCVFHDEMPDLVLKEEGYMDQDPKMEFVKIPLVQVNVEAVYGWIQNYFLNE